MSFPLQATGSVGGSLFGRMLGMSRVATFVAIVIGNVIGNGVMYLGSDLISEQPPRWLVWIVIPQYASLGYLAYLDWQQALSVYVLTFLLAMFLSVIMELIGAILLIPLRVLYKMAHRWQQ